MWHHERTRKEKEGVGQPEQQDTSPELEKGPSAKWVRLQASIWPTWITRDAGLLLFARACMSATRALSGVIVPIYLAINGFSGLTLGLLFTTVAITSAVLSALIGLLSDRFGRKPFLFAVPLLTALAALVFAFSHVTALLFFFAALGSFGRGAGAGAGAIGPYQPAEQAILAGTVPARYRNSLFGRVAFASSLGSLVGGGPLIALSAVLTGISLSNAQGGAAYRFTFLIMAALAIMAGLLALPITDPLTGTRLARQAHIPAGTQTTQPVTRRKERFTISSQSRSLLFRLWTTNSLNGLAIGFFGPCITYWFYRRYGAGPVTIGFLYSFINLGALVANLGAARLAARLGLVRAIVLSRALQAVLILPMVLAPTFWLAGAFYFLRMFAQRTGLPLRQSYVMGVIEPEERGTVGALSNLPAQAASAIGPTLAGYLFDHVALALPFEIGALLQGINTALYFVFFHAIPPPEELASSKGKQPLPESVDDGEQQSPAAGHHASL
ncbi:MAG: tetracycline resistance MFS efflux pump [Ktedonobacteraceae bacterium]